MNKYFSIIPEGWKPIRPTCIRKTIGHYFLDNYIEISAWPDGEYYLFFQKNYARDCKIFTSLEGALAYAEFQLT